MMKKRLNIELNVEQYELLRKQASVKGELYGFERFLKSIEEGRELGTDELLEKLVDDVLLYVGKVEQYDDLTAVVVKVS